MTTLEATRTGSLRPAAHALFGLFVAAQLAIVTFTIWEPPFDGAIRYDDIAPLGDTYWPMNVLLGGPGYALSAVAASIFLAVLVAGRGNVVGLVGVGINLVAGIVFALVITAEVLPFAWAADPSMVDEAQGRALFDVYNDHFDAFLPYIIGSMAGVALGVLLAVTGAAISGTLRWWVPAVAAALIVAQFTVPLGSPLGLVLGGGERVLWLYLGWRGLKALLARA